MPSSVASRTRVSSSGRIVSVAASSFARLVRIGAMPTSGVISCENLIRPIRSCGAAWRKKPLSPSLACSSLFSSPIEPELSKTIITLAGLRSARQVALILASTFGSGSAQHAGRLLRVDAVGAA